ncbi:hypothetical protein DERF_003292 [Dermatophagoides farinae]|uniref:Uncharacterized protein n=1 Tax=Dermatophagoides farinae TaxID=6954 RepID=A0A922LDI6_DERFA|nr:hypothetical protein DERF_003292 [Dermatophagoides farinae]
MIMLMNTFKSYGLLNNFYHYHHHHHHVFGALFSSILNTESFQVVKCIIKVEKTNGQFLSDQMKRKTK